MPTPIFQPGDEILFRNNGSEIRGVVSLVHGSQVTFLAEDGRKLTRNSHLLTHLGPMAAPRRVLPLLPIHERLTLLSQAVEMVASKLSPSLILVGPPRPRQNLRGHAHAPGSGPRAGSRLLPYQRIRLCARAI